MNFHSLRFISVFVLGVSLVACSNSNTSTKNIDEPVSTTLTDPPASSTVQPVPEQLPTIVARINDVEIHREELQRAVRAAETQAGQVVPPQFRDQVYRRVLDRLVEFHLLLQEARTQQIIVSLQEVEDEIARVRDSYPTIEAFQQQLNEWNSTLEALEDETRKDLLVAKTIEAELEPATSLDETAIQAFYEQHPGQFTSDEAVQASHILIGVESSSDTARRQEARLMAEALHQQVTTSPESFSDVARDNSTDEATADRGGLLGFIARGQTAPSFEEALFGLQPQEISEVVESPFGFHIIKAGEKRDATAVPYETAREQIRELLIQQEQQSLMAEFLSRLRESAKVEILI